MQRGSVIILQALLPVAGACVPQLPSNVKTETRPQRSILFEAAGAFVEVEEGVEDALWLNLPTSGGDSAIGGYLSNNEPERKALLIVLHGASTFNRAGGVGSAYVSHRLLAGPYREAGYLTLSLTYQECGTAYGQGDVQDVLEVLDWLERGGGEVLGVERVYLLGYSTGATIATLVNRQRTVAGVVAISGLLRPTELETFHGLYRLLTGMYLENEAMCQLRVTLDTYGPPGSPEWQILDSVSAIDELRSPMLIVHGVDDIIYSPQSAYELQRAYAERVSAGRTLPPLEFAILNGQGHFGIELDADVIEAALLFLDTHR